MIVALIVEGKGLRHHASATAFGENIHIRSADPHDGPEKGTDMVLAQALA